MAREAPETASRCTEQEALANLSAVLQLCAGGKLRASERTRRPSMASVGAVAGVLVDGDFYPDEPIAAFAWPLLIQAGGLAELAGSRLQLTARGRTAMSKPAAATLQGLWHRWITHGVIDEMSRIEGIKGQRATNVLSAIKPRRQTVALAVQTLLDTEWLTVDQLFAAMRLHDLSPAVARNDRSIWKLYLVEPEYGSLGYDGFHGWNLLEGRYTLCVLFEYAATLGLVDIEYGDPVGARDDYRDNWGADFLDFLSRYDGLRAVRLNRLGSYIVGQNDRYQPAAAPGTALTVLANHDVVAAGTIAPADRLVLEAYAVRTSDRVWSVTTASLLAAHAAGRPSEEFAEFLRGRARTGVPATVQQLLDDVGGRAAQLRDRGLVRLVECADAATATLVGRDRAARELCSQVGERHLAVPAEHDGAFRKAVRSLGYVLS